jgi:chromosome segregation ATPase
MEMPFFSGSAYKKQDRYTFYGRKIAKSVPVLIIFAILISGCTGKDRQITKEEILQFDPGFADVLAKKESLDTEIASLQRQFMQEKAVIDAKIDALQQELKVEKDKLNSDIQSVKAQLEPERSAIIAEIKEIKQSLKTKRDSLRQVRKMSTSAQALSQKGESPSQEDKEKWEKMMPVLEDETKRLNKQIFELKTQLKYLNSELNLLRQ